MKLINAAGIPAGMTVFNPGGLPVKKLFVFKNRAVVVDPDAEPFGGRANKIIVKGVVYKFCGQCCRFHELGSFYVRKSGGMMNYCIECEKCLMARRYAQNRDYYLIKSRQQYFRLLEKAGFPKDRRRKENREQAPAKHWHPWSKRGKFKETK